MTSLAGCGRSIAGTIPIAPMETPLTMCHRLQGRSGSTCVMFQKTSRTTPGADLLTTMSTVIIDLLAANMTEPNQLVRCNFYVRRPAESGGWQYDLARISGPDGDGTLHTEHPPLVGDLIFLWGADQDGPGLCRVVVRSWMHSSWGSTNWPYGHARSTVGPMLDLVVEEAGSILQDEAVRPDDGDDLESASDSIKRGAGPGYPPRGGEGVNAEGG